MPFNENCFLPGYLLLHISSKSYVSIIHQQLQIHLTNVPQCRTVIPVKFIVHCLITAHSNNDFSIFFLLIIYNRRTDFIYKFYPFIFIYWSIYVKYLTTSFSMLYFKYIPSIHIYEVLISSMSSVSGALPASSDSMLTASCSVSDHCLSLLSKLSPSHSVHSQVVHMQWGWSLQCWYQH